MSANGDAVAPQRNPFVDQMVLKQRGDGKFLKKYQKETASWRKDMAALEDAGRYPIAPQYLVAVLDELAAYARVRAVRGNNDGPDVAAWGAPGTLDLDLGGLLVAMIHDSGPATGRPARLRRRFPAADLVIFGHSHLPLDHAEHDQRIFNPGSPTDRRRQPYGTLGRTGSTQRPGQVTTGVRSPRGSGHCRAGRPTPEPGQVTGIAGKDPVTGNGQEDNGGVDRVSGARVSEQGSRLPAVAGTHGADVDSLKQAGQINLPAAPVTTKMETGPSVMPGWPSAAGCSASVMVQRSPAW